jgi:alkylation response protein AidB-like acyl-CoA dehydrogenase
MHNVDDYKMLLLTQTKDNLTLNEFGAIRSKLADMATSCYAGESATYRASKISKIELLLVS